MDGGYWQAGATRLRRAVGFAAAVGVTTATALAAGTGVASSADFSVGCAQSGPFVTCGYLGTPAWTTWSTAAAPHDCSPPDPDGPARSTER
ncbi:hypothetical protein ACFYVR_00695 [Rhodococcus sp. NPDC003318]|uniref:hypothetical protein n=1 Tax=Rhodococcus sp. NPDC003318 TaxID=3364503 RepID=UPI0036791E35